MELIACQCQDLPPHDHMIPNKRPDQMTEEERAGYALKVYSPFRYGGPFEIGRIWIDWKEVAKGLIKEK